ncbi:MAG: hypothetical protein AB7I38_13505 [Dehalococcoidia bacterium]
MTSAADRPAFWPEIRWALLAAMAIFLYTIGIGILNGTDLVDFDQRRILGHVHGGTLGWLTLSVFAASLWLFGGYGAVSERQRLQVRLLVVAAVIAFALYVAAFSLTYNEFRPAMGAVSTVVILAFFAWILMRVPRTELGVPHWGFLAAMASSVIGGVLGVLLGLQIATGDKYLPDGGSDAHPAMMVVGFLFPVALAMSEWAFVFPSPPSASRAGVIQMVFPFAGGIVLMVGLLLDNNALPPVAILLEIIGVIIFLVRMWPRFRTVNFFEAGSGRWAAFSAVGSVFVIGLAQYFIIDTNGDFDLVPTHQLLALDHSQFIASMTSAVFAMLFAATASRDVDARLHHIVFALVVIGVVGFVTGLLADSTVMKRVFAPTMGTGLLIGLGVFAAALLRSDERTEDRTVSAVPSIVEAS